MVDGNEEQQEKIEIESPETDNDTVAFAVLTSKNGCDDYQSDKFSVMPIAEAFEFRNTANLSDDDLSGHIVKLKANTEELSLSLTLEVRCLF